MKKVLMLSLLCIVIGSAAMAQSVDISQALNASPEELAQMAAMYVDEVDLSDVEFYFAGPVDLLVRNVEFMGTNYAAILSYDGEGTFEIQMPDSTSPMGLPTSLDLSEIAVTADLEKIRVSNIIANGYYFSGDLVVQDPVTDLGITAAYIGRQVPTVDVEAYEDQIADLEAEVDALTAENQDLAADLAAARADAPEQVATLQNQLDDAEDEIADLEDEIADLEGEIADLEDDLDDAEDEIARLEGGADAAPAAVTLVRRARTVMPDPELASPAGGTWSLSDRGLTQSNPQTLFGKYAGSYSPQGAQLVYGISGRANGDGWRGFGLHFQASGSVNKDRYGFGESYLIWVTRDPMNLGTDQTFVQLYKSFSDTSMIQVASTAIDGDIADGVEVNVVADRMAGTVHVVYDGEVLFDYEDDDFYVGSNQVAVRALGNVTITGVELPQ